MITGAITIKVESVYGNRLYYPRCDEAKTFAEIAGAKTLTPRIIKLIRSLGIIVNVHPADMEEIV
jgi:hypothetical protein